MVKPYWRIWVDWNGNGAWNETSGDYREDVTRDVLDLDWSWGESPQSLRGANPGRRPAAPARLNLTLRNNARRYTPGNGKSPLAGNLTAGRRVWAAMAYPYDGFSGADNADISGRAVPLGESLAWSKVFTGAAGVVLDDGMAKPTNGSGGALYTLDFGDADAHVGFVYRRSGNGASGVALRVASRWDYLRVRFGNSGTVLEDVTFGFASVVRRGDPLVAGRDYFLEIEMHGSSVRMFATDLSEGSADRKTILDGGGNAGNQTSTKHGLWHDGSSAATADRWGEFGGWRSFFVGSLVRLSPERDRNLGYVCRCEARDDLHLLGQRPLYNLLSTSNQSSASVANSVLTWAGFNANHRRLDGGQILVASQPRAFWRISAATALGHVAAEENGHLYVDGRGYVVLESAGHRRAGAHTTARTTLRDKSGYGPYFSDLTWDEGGENVENSVAFRYRLPASQGSQEVWRLREVAAIPPGASRDFLAESDRYEVVDSFAVPVSGADYGANSRADGKGADLTSSMTVSLPYVPSDSESSPPDRYRGRGTVVRVSNGHGTATAYLTLLRLMAARTYDAPNPTSYRADDATSQASHGLRDVTVDCRLIDNYAAAQQGADARLAEGKTPRARLVPHPARRRRRQPGPNRPPHPLGPGEGNQLRPQPERRLLHRRHAPLRHRQDGGTDCPLAGGGFLIAPATPLAYNSAGTSPLANLFQ